MAQPHSWKRALRLRVRRQFLLSLGVFLLVVNIGWYLWEPRKDNQDVQPIISVSSGQSSCPAEISIPKVALLFLTRGPMPHEGVWRLWLKSATGLVPVTALEAGLCSGQAVPCLLTGSHALAARQASQQRLFSLYVHTSPGFSGYPRSSIFYGAVIPDLVEVKWGTHSLAEAERRLFRAALVDPLNQRFQLLCEASLPLYPPTVVYLQTMGEAKSRINACKTSNEESLVDRRWTVHMALMAPALVPEVWRKSQQWLMLVRAHAELVARDVNVSAAFERHCFRTWDIMNDRERDCYSDEHYIPTLLAVHGRDAETSCSGNAMHVDWSEAEQTSWEHPKAYDASHISAEAFNLLRTTNGQGAQECPYNDAIRSAELGFVTALRASEYKCNASRTLAFKALPEVPCILFARKFPEEVAPQVQKLLTSCESRLHVTRNLSCWKGSNMRLALEGRWDQVEWPSGEE